MDGSLPRTSREEGGYDVQKRKSPYATFIKNILCTSLAKLFISILF
jgi:hypothetical protein